MNSNFVAILVFAGLCVAIYTIYGEATVSVTQCPGMLLSETRTIEKLDRLGYLGLDIGYCSSSKMKRSEMNLIRRLQKATEL